MEIGLKYLLSKAPATEIVVITIKNPASIISAEAHGYTWAIRADAEKHGIPIDTNISNYQDFTNFD